MVGDAFARDSLWFGERFGDPVADVTGARSTATVKIGSERIEDVAGDGVFLRSQTQTGEAHVVPDGETLPSLRQDQVPDGVPQESCTPFGEATVLGADGRRIRTGDPAVIAEVQAELDAGAKPKARKKPPSKKK